MSGFLLSLGFLIPAGCSALPVSLPPVDPGEGVIPSAPDQPNFPRLFFQAADPLDDDDPDDAASLRRRPEVGGLTAPALSRGLLRLSAWPEPNTAAPPSARALLSLLCRLLL